MARFPLASGKLCPRCGRSTMRFRVPWYIYLLPTLWMGLSSYRYCTPCDRSRLHLHWRKPTARARPPQLRHFS
jgi:hypothetical protein